MVPELSAVVIAEVFELVLVETVVSEVSKLAVSAEVERPNYGFILLTCQALLKEAAFIPGKLLAFSILKEAGRSKRK